VKSNEPSDDGRADFERDVPTTPEDVHVLRELRHRTPSWLTLTADEIDGLLPRGALARRPAAKPGRRPFALD
jgi:hypothetical protein